MPKPTINPFAGSNSAWQLAPTLSNRAGDTPTRHGSWHPLGQKTTTTTTTQDNNQPTPLEHGNTEQEGVSVPSNNNNKQHKTTTNQQHRTMGICRPTNHHTSVQSVVPVPSIMVRLIVELVPLIFYEKLSSDVIYTEVARHGSWHPLLLGMGVGFHLGESCRGYSYSARELKKLTTPAPRCFFIIPTRHGS